MKSILNKAIFTVRVICHEVALQNDRAVCGETSLYVFKGKFKVEEKVA